MALGHARDLDMADAGDVLAQLHREIALDDLAVIEIHLHLEVKCADFRADGVRLVLAVEEKTRNVAGVDRLDHDGDAGRGRLSRRIVEIAHIGRAVERAVLARPDQAGHQVHALVAEHARILERARDAAPEFVFAAGQRGEAALARVPIARRPVEQRLGEAVLGQARADVRSRVSVWEQELDALEAVLRGGVEALEESVLLIHHRQVGGESGHGVSP